MGKTETIKERAVWVYAPTIEQRKKWEDIAKRKGMPLSKWIVQTIEDSLLELDDDVKSRKDIEKYTHLRGTYRIYVERFPASL